jgi:hypothetical protein
MKVSQPSQAVTDQRILWRTRNRRALGGIAKRFGLSYTFVRWVFLGLQRSADDRVERALAEKGCPGFEQYLPADAAGSDDPGVREDA